MVKCNKNAIVVGEETLGEFYGHTGHIPVNYEMPNSKLQLAFSIVDLNQGVISLSDEKSGDGVKPDINVKQSLEDFILNKDTQLNFVLNHKVWDSIPYQRQR